MSDNWVVRNLENALETWNDKLTEIWGLLTATPEEFKGGKIWNVILDINGALQVIGTALLVLFFVVGVMKTCGSFAEVKKPEHALRLFIRFALAKGAITYGLDLMLSLFKIVQGTISTIMTSAGFGQAKETTLPQEMITAIENCDFFESIPLWAVTLIGSLLITVLSFIMIMTVYGRFFSCICILPLHRYRFQHLQESRHSMSAGHLSKAIVLYAWKVQLLFLPASYSHFLQRHRRKLIQLHLR